MVECTLTKEDLTEYQVEIPNIYGFGHIDFLRDVVRALSENVPHPIQYEDASKTIELLNAIYISMEDNKIVYLAERPVSRRLGRKDQRLIDLYLTKEK